MKQKLPAILLALVLIIVCPAVNLFFIGEPVDAEQLYFETEISGENLILEFHSVESAMALRDIDARYNERTIHVTARKVPVTPLFPSGSGRLTMDITDIDQVKFADTVIWTRP